MPGMNGSMRFEGPDAMTFGPNMPMLRQRLRDLPNDQQLERLRELPNRIQLRTPMRIKTLSPSRVRAPRVYKVDRGPDATWTATDTPDVISVGGDEMEFDDSDIFEFDEPFSFELEEPFDALDDIEFVSPETIRDLVSTTIRDARVALAQLAAARIV
jgi:hypothetical protein